MLIGLTGKAQAGKDTVGSILFLNHGFMRVAFADPVKEAAAAMYDLSLVDFHDNALKERIDHRWGMSPRSMVQQLGEMVKERFGPDFWVDNWFHRYSKVGESNHVIVTDVRFDNEAQRIIDLGGVIIEVLRNDSGLSGDNAAHVSEAGIKRKLINCTIVNNSTKRNLAAYMDILVNSAMPVQVELDFTKEGN